MEPGRKRSAVIKLLFHDWESTAGIHRGLLKVYRKWCICTMIPKVDGLEELKSILERNVQLNLVTGYTVAGKLLFLLVTWNLMLYISGKYNCTKCVSRILTSDYNEQNIAAQ